MKCSGYEIFVILTMHSIKPTFYSPYIQSRKVSRWFVHTRNVRKFKGMLMHRQERSRAICIVQHNLLALKLLCVKLLESLLLLLLQYFHITRISKTGFKAEPFLKFLSFQMIRFESYNNFDRESFYEVFDSFTSTNTNVIYCKTISYVLNIFSLLPH